MESAGNEASSSIGGGCTFSVAVAAAAAVAADAEFERNPGRPGELLVAILILGTFLILRFGGIEMLH